MAFNGAGVFNRIYNWVNDKNASIPITASRMDTEDNGFATGLSLCLTKDGQQAAAANLPMGGFKHTNVATGSSTTDYARLDQLQNNTASYAGTSSGTNTVTAGTTPALGAYSAGQAFSFLAGGTNTGAATLNISALGAKAIQKLGAALVAGDITIGDIVEVEYDGTQFQMTSPVRTPVIAAQGVSGLAITNNTLPAAALLSTIVHDLVAKTTLVSADEIAISDSAASNAAKKITYANLVAVLQSALCPKDYISGCILSNNVGTPNTKVDIASGIASDSTNVQVITSAGYTVDFSVNGAVNRLDAGTIAATTWYHLFLIAKTDGTTGGLASLSPTAPTLPTGYTLFRRIGAVKTDGTIHILAFVQTGDEFLWAASILEFDTTNPGTSAVTVTLKGAPTGVKCWALITAGMFNGTNSQRASYWSSLDQNDEAPVLVTTAALAVPGGTFLSSDTGAVWHFMPLKLRTNTSAQIRYRLYISGAADHAGAVSYGWIDQRGKDV